MTPTLRTAALAVALTFAGSASAQPARTTDRARLGIGVGLPTSSLDGLVNLLALGDAGVQPAQIYLPIAITPAFRLEPQFGLFTLDQDGGDSLSVFTLGAGAFHVMGLGDSADLYAGGRLAVSWLSEETEGGGFVEQRDGTDLWIAAALGGEVLLHPRIGIGAEAQLGRLGIGDREVTTAGIPQPDEPGGSSWQTRGVIFVRVYLF
jgi:hypothetical protein